MSESKGRDNDKVNELRFELAWRWFALHSSQRVSMFNFFLVSAGVLANAYVFLIIDKIYFLAGFLGFITVIIAASFVLLDRRNRQLIKMGEDLLVHLEATELHTREQSLNNSATTSLRGLLIREKAEGEPRFYMKHWFLIEATEILLACIFLAGGIFAFTR